MKKCPRCGGEARRSHRHGFLQQRILGPLRIRPFRCRDCGVLIYRFSSNGADGHTATTTRIFEKPQNRNGQFKTLIADMRQKELELGLVKQNHGIGEELRRPNERTQAEGLTRAPKAAEEKRTAVADGPTSRSGLVN